MLLSVRLYVCPSVAHIANNSRTQRPRLACPNLEGRFTTLNATRIPVSTSNGQRSGLEAGGGIPCRPNPAATLIIIFLKLCKKKNLKKLRKNGKANAPGGRPTQNFIIVSVAVPLASWGTTAATRVPRLRIGECLREWTRG